MASGLPAQEAAWLADAVLHTTAHKCDAEEADPASPDCADSLQARVCCSAEMTGGCRTGWHAHLHPVSLCIPSLDKADKEASLSMWAPSGTGFSKLPSFHNA